MMTGRDLIIYILQHNLLDDPVYDERDGELLGFYSVEDVAVNHHVGIATVEAWVKTGVIKSVKIGDKIYIPVKPLFCGMPPEFKNKE